LKTDFHGKNDSSERRYEALTFGKAARLTREPYVLPPSNRSPVEMKSRFVYNVGSTYQPNVLARL
jgi:hypothetical protein